MTSVNPANIPVSVIVPIYNSGPWLARCIDSLTRQTMGNIQIILVDDGSTDNSGEIAEQYAESDKRITVVRQKNMGVAVARNAGLDIAKGEYVGFVDSDDFVDRDYFQTLCDAARKSGADFVRGKAKVVSMDGGTAPMDQPFEEIKKNRGWLMGCCWATLYRRGFLEENKIRFPDGVIVSQDWVFHVKVICQTDRIELVEKDSYYNYIRRENSADSAVLSDAKIQARIGVFHMIVDFMNGIELDEWVYSVIFRIWMDYMFAIMPRNHKIRMKLAVIDCVIDVYGKCKYPEIYAGKYKPLLETADETGLLIRVLEDSGVFHRKPKQGRRRKLFGFIPLRRKAA